MYEVVYRLSRDHFYCNLSRKYLSFKMFFWCNELNEVLEIVVHNPDEYKLVVKEFSEKKGSEIIEESSDQQKVHIIVKKCSCAEDNSVLMHMGGLNMLHIFPSVITNGWEYHRVIGFQHEDFSELMRRLEKNKFNCEVIRKAPYDGIIASSLSLTADTLLSDLSDKQIDAFLAAHRHGYYRFPKKSNIQMIASKEHVARTTYQEHLKKAESKLMEALAPYIALFKNTSTEQRKRLKMKTQE